MDEEKTMGTDPAPFSDDVLEALRGIDARLGALEGRLASIEAGLHADAPRTHAPPGGAAAPAPTPPAMPVVPPAMGAPVVPPPPQRTGVPPQAPTPAPVAMPGFAAPAMPVVPAMGAPAVPPPPQRTGVPPQAPPPGPWTVPPAAPSWTGAPGPVPRGQDPLTAAPSRPARTESRVGTYLLAGAAALLVILSGATLVAMLWDAIPDTVKVGAVLALGVGLTATGTWLALRRHVSGLHAATVMGIGGGLGFVGLMGACLLGIVPAVPAFAALGAWTLVLIVLAACTRLVLTTVIAALGGVATAALAAGQAAARPQESLLALLLMVSYVGATALASAVVVRVVPPTARPAHLVAPLLLVVVTAVLAPFEGAHRISVPGTAAATGLLVGVLVAHLLVLTACARAAQDLREAPPADRDGQGPSPAARPSNPWGAAWLGAPLVLAVLFVRLIALPDAPLDSRTSSHLLLAVLGAAALARLLPAVRPTFAAWAGHCLLAAALLAGLIGSPLGGLPAPLLGELLLVALLAEVSVLLAGDVSGAWVLGLLAVLVQAVAANRWDDSVVVLANALAVVCLVLLADHLLPGNGAVRPTTLVVAALLVWRVPLTAAATAGGLGLPQRWVPALGWGLSAAALVLLAALGLGQGLHRPLALLAGRHAGDRARPVTGTGRTRPSSWASVILALVAWAWSWNWTLLDAAAPDGVAAAQGQRIVLGAATLALAVAVVWLLAPLLALPFHGLVAALVGTWLVVAATLLVRDTAVTGAAAGVAMLVSGALAIVLGFRRRARAVRLYGLCLVILMVLRFAFWDLGAQSSLTRVLALLVGGLVCFGLSVLYARADAQWGAPSPAAQAAPPAAQQAVAWQQGPARPQQQGAPGWAPQGPTPWPGGPPVRNGG